MNQLYDINTAASLLSISPWTVRHYISIGKLQPVRIGRRVLLDEAELARLVTTGKRSATTSQLSRRDDLDQSQATEQLGKGEMTDETR